MASKQFFSYIKGRTGYFLMR